MNEFLVLGMYGLGSAELLAIFFVLALFLIPYILYLITLQNTLKLCAPHNRTLTPGLVWLVLIPLFGHIWYFIVVNRMADSIAAELRQRNVPSREQRPGYSVGIALCILSVCSMIPVLGGLCSLAALVCWIIYWVRIHNYKKMLEDTTFQFGQGNPYPFPNQPQGYPPQYPGQFPNHPNQ
jgi:hypothetical protein